MIWRAIVIIIILLVLWVFALNLAIVELLKPRTREEIDHQDKRFEENRVKEAEKLKRKRIKKEGKLL